MALDLRHNMTNHTPNPAGIATIEALREQFIELGEAVQESTPASREQSLALTSLEEALMWAVAAIARNGNPTGTQQPEPASEDEGAPGGDEPPAAS